MSKLWWRCRVPVLALVLVTMAGVMACASDWQWTKGQGWSEGAGKPRETSAEQLRYAYSLEKQGEFYDAARQYFLLVRVYPASEEAGVALQRLAKCLFDMENYYESYKAVEQVLTRYPNSGRLADLVAIQFKIGRKLQQGGRPSILEDADPVEEGHKAALEAFASILKHDPYGPLADDALVAQGRSYLALRDAKSARGCFNRLVNDFGKSDLVGDARIGLVQCDVLEGKAHSYEVQRKMEQIRARRPEELSQEEENALQESVNSLEELEAEKMWKGAQFYERRGSRESLKAALFQYNEIVRRYPRTSYARKALERANAIKVPEKDSFSLPKIDLNPFRKKKKPAFVTPQRGAEAVQSEVVMPAIPGAPAVAGESNAHVVPMSPERSQPISAPVATPSQGIVPPVHATDMPGAPALVVDEMSDGTSADAGADHSPVLDMTPERREPESAAALAVPGGSTPAVPLPEATAEAAISSSGSGGVGAVPRSMGSSVIVRTPMVSEPGAAATVSKPPKALTKGGKAISGAWAIDLGGDTRVVKPLATPPAHGVSGKERQPKNATSSSSAARPDEPSIEWAGTSEPEVSESAPVTPVKDAELPAPPGVVPDTPAQQEGPQLEKEEARPLPKPEEPVAAQPSGVSKPVSKKQSGWQFSEDLR